MAKIARTDADLESKIKETKRWLKKQKKQINDLKGLLKIAKQDFSRLKDELATYKAARAPSPINACPPEILSMIFKLSVTETPERVNCLLLVCRRWHNLVINDPQMWNVISIQVPRGEWDISSWAQSTRSFLATCLKRSRSAGLHVKFDFAFLQTAQEQIVLQFAKAFSSILSSRDRNILENWLYGLEYDDLLEHLDASINCQPTNAVSLIHLLTDPCDGVLGRWESLTIQGPVLNDDSMLAWLIWGSITRGSLNLSSLEVMNLDLRALEEAYGDLPIPTLHLPCLETLKIDILSGLNRYISLDPLTMQVLVARISFGTDCLLQLAWLSQLTHLTIMACHLSEPIDFSTSKRISLPLLQELTLEWIPLFLDTVEFDLRSLRSLNLHWSGETTPAHVRTVQPSRVCWEAGPIRMSVKALKTTLQGFLLHYTNSEELVVPLPAKKVLIKLLKRLSVKGKLPSKWRFVSFQWDSLETLSIDDIVSRA